MPRRRKGYKKRGDDSPSPGQLLGRQGGLARAKKLSPLRRKQIAKHAAEVRWGKSP